MKRRFFNCVLASLFAFVLISCDKDEDDSSNVTIDTIVGNYDGNMDCDVNVMGRIFNIEYENIKASIDKNVDLKSCKIVIYDFTYNGDNYGNIVISNVIINANNNNFSFVGEGTTILTKNGDNYDATVSLNGEYDYSQNNISLNISMNLPVNPKMTIAFEIKYESINHENY